MRNPAVFVTARILLASVFIGLGLSRLLAGAGMISGTATPITAGVIAFSVVELVIGLMIAAGWQVRRGALLMAAFLLVDAFAAHAFWRHPGPEMHGQLLHFLKNLAAIGGLLLLSWVASRQADGTIPPR